ncbi:hypothetical protein KEM54_003883 [Ascosphaera aggregata]|nr:hypothetical protein KEM54_003883 [Ascosphaera aggregata]
MAQLLALVTTLPNMLVCGALYDVARRQTLGCQNGHRGTGNTSIEDPSPLPEVLQGWLTSRKTDVASVMAWVHSQYPSPKGFEDYNAGVKGNSRLYGDQLLLRDSMTKFEATGSAIETCESGTRARPLHLNQQMIRILEDLGVPGIHAITATRSPKITHNSQLGFHGSGLTRRDAHPGFDRFSLAYQNSKKEPGEKPAASGCEDGQTQVLVRDNIVITQSPAVDPGGIQFVNAVKNVDPDRPLRKLHTCVVFSQRGFRDLFSMLSGGDLDGDLTLSMTRRCFQDQDMMRPNIHLFWSSNLIGLY